MTAATECLPPDPATPGLWWLSTPAAPVMRAWQPAPRVWADTDGGRTAASSAHAAGWRVLAAAVPPGDTTPAWRPMATAPKNGVPILVAHGNFVALCRYKKRPGGYGPGIGFQHGYVVQNPLGWMPAPLPMENAP